jgi:hypothetical protein
MLFWPKAKGNVGSDVAVTEWGCFRTNEKIYPAMPAAAPKGALRRLQLPVFPGR